MTRVAPALTGAVLSLLLAVAAAAGTVPLVAALAAVAGAVAFGWATLLALPTPRGSAVLLGLGGAGALAVVTLTAQPPLLRWLPSVLALGVLAEFARQLLRRDMRPRLVESVTGVVCGLVVVCLAAAWLAGMALRNGSGVVVAGAVASLAASGATGLPWPQRLTGPFAVVAAGAFAALAGRLLPEHTAIPMALVGLGVGAVVAALDRLLAHLPTAGYRRSSVARGAAPVAVSGMVVYTLGRLVT